MLLINELITSLNMISNSPIENLFTFFLQTNSYKSDVQIYKYVIYDPDLIFETDELTLKKFETLYIKAKNIKNIFKKYIKKSKWEKSLKYSVDTDLYLNNLSDFNEKYTITILENNTRYRFRLSDLVNYWVESLTKNEGLFPDPLPIKNPYTNIPFSNHNLYNIYFKLLHTGFQIPFYISIFVKNHMNLKDFHYYNLPLLKETAINNFHKSNLIYEKWEQILNMLHDFRREIDYITFSTIIEHNLKKEICKKLSNILLFYLKYKFSHNPLISRDAKRKVKNMLLSFLDENPDFGYRRNEEVIRYVPFTDTQIDIRRNRRGDRRRRTYQSPPPPPPIPLTVINPLSGISIPSTAPPPPPPNPIRLPLIPLIDTPEQIDIIENINPFLPTSELPRTPMSNSQAESTSTTTQTSRQNTNVSVNVRNTITNNLSLFGR